MTILYGIEIKHSSVHWNPRSFVNKNNIKNLGSQIEFSVPTFGKAPDECRVKYRDVANEWLNMASDPSKMETISKP